jgi:intraflagellar transport protein 172
LLRYVHQQDWENATRVAESYDPVAIPDVYTAHAKTKVDSGEFKAAEELYLSASRPELALAMYQELNDWSFYLFIFIMDCNILFE